MSGSRPLNIVWIMSDQHPGSATGYEGHSVVQTPNIDALAASGLSFRNAYTTCPVCVPARFSAMSRKYPHTTGCVNNNTPLPFYQRTLAHALSGAGYATAFIGKMHPVDPQPHGFDFYVDMGHYYDYLGPKTEIFVRGMRADDSGCGAPWVHTWYNNSFTADQWLNAPKTPGLPDLLDEPDHFEAFVARNCQTFMEKIGQEHPFFLFASMIKPHYPQASPPEYHALYDPKQMPVPEITASERAALSSLPDSIVQGCFEDPHKSPEAYRTAQQFISEYFAATTYMDACVGRIVGSLDELGLADNTLVIYTSDHGEMLYHHGLVQKFVFYEESVRIPLVVRAPGLVQAGASTAALTDFTDLVPTMLDVLGLPDTLHTDGKSLLPVLRDPAAHVRAACFSEIRDHYMIRSSHYKLATYGDDRRQLYDVEADPGERTNLAADPAYAEVMADLERQLLAWRAGAVEREA